MRRVLSADEWIQTSSADAFWTSLRRAWFVGSHTGALGYVEAASARLYEAAGSFSVIFFGRRHVFLGPTAA